MESSFRMPAVQRNAFRLENPTGTPARSCAIAVAAARAV